MNAVNTTVVDNIRLANVIQWVPRNFHVSPKDKTSRVAAIATNAVELIAKMACPVSEGTTVISANALFVEFLIAMNRLHVIKVANKSTKNEIQGAAGE